MPGWEMVDHAERFAVQDVFTQNKGIAFAHGFDAMRDRFFVRELEKATAEAVGARYCQAVSSGSAGLYCALRALGIGPGDNVITSAFTFIATVEAILLCGAIPVPVDIDGSFNLDPECVERAVNEFTKAIIPVHMAGGAANMDAIIGIAEQHGLGVIEDACQAMGATYRGEPVGTLGDLGVYSLDAGKAIQCGEGGLVVTNNKELYEKARMAHDHGHDYNGPGRALEVPRMWGFNFRMTELQGAYALAQLRKLPHIIEQQRRNYTAIKNAIGESAFPIARATDEGQAGDSLLVTAHTREGAVAIVAALKERGVGTKNVPDALNWHFAENWRHIFPHGSWPRTWDLLSRSVAIPVPVKMAEDYPQRVAAALEAVK